jgi:hypothetical protein
MLWKAESHSACQTIPTFFMESFIIVLTKGRHPTLSWASRIQFAPSIPISLRSILMLSSHLRLGLPNNHQYGGLPPVGCLRLLIQYIRSYPPYLEAFSSISNLRMRHAIVTRDPPKMVQRPKANNQGNPPEIPSRLNDRPSNIASYSEGPRFESRQENLIPDMVRFLLLPLFPPAQHLQRYHNRLLPNPSRLIIPTHLPISLDISVETASLKP